MTAATIFSLCNATALLGWLCLLAALAWPRLRPAVFPATGIALPCLFAVAYLGVLAAAIATGPGGGGFGSIPEVRALFAGDLGLTAGWVHYLAFDLFVGTWIARAGLAAGLPRLALAPILVLGFLFGPLGLLGFTLLHLARRRCLPPLPGASTPDRGSAP